MKLFRLCLLVLLTLSLSGSIVSHSSAQQSSASWTVMVYMAADNDLETFGLADINEMEFAAESDDVHVVAQVDRSENYNTTDGNWTEGRRYLIQHDTNISRIGSTELDELGEINTGDPQTLVDFVTWTAENYPAEHYALVIWDHGGAWLGGATDESADFDDLTLPELTTAFDQIQENTGIEKFDVLGFDACLMGALEVYEAIAPYALYGVGSAELIPGNGWNYYGALDALVADPSMDGEAFGRVIVDQFVTFYQDFATNYPLYSLAVVDLSQTQRVTEAFDALVAALEANPQTVNEVGLARNETLVFGAFDDPMYADLWAATDLLQFLDYLAANSSDADLQAAAQEALDAGRALMLYSQGSEPLADSGGLSIYFPRTVSYYEQDNRAADYARYAPSDLIQWQSFLDTFYTLAAVLTGDQEMIGQVLGFTTDQDQVVVDLQLGGTGLVQAAFVVLLDIGNDQPIVIDYDRLGSEETPSVTWAAKVPYLTDGNAEVPVLLLRGRTPGMGVVGGTLYPRSGTPSSAQLLVDLESNEVVSVWGIRQTGHGQVRSELAVEDGDLFQPTWLTLDDDNAFIPTLSPIRLVMDENTLTFASQDFYAKPASGNGLFLIWRTAPPGAYELRGLVDGVGGGTGSDGLGVVVSNDGGYTSLTELDLTNPDIDADGILNEEDNCYVVPNTDQADEDGDGIGDVCDLFDNRDIDQDGILGNEDNCPSVWNADQADSDEDGVGDVCQQIADRDSDGVVDSLDNCPDDANANQVDSDDDGVGDICDEGTPPPAVVTDTDQDGIVNEDDNCPDDANADQSDVDADGLGDVCDDVNAIDSDGDGIPNDTDNCPSSANPYQEDADEDGRGNWCDNCSNASNADQLDSDGDGLGDACELPVGPTATPQISDLAISLSAPSTATGGSALSYTATVQNVGSQNVTNIQVSQAIPTEMPGANYAVSQGSYNGSLSDYLWDIGTLAPGASASLSVNGTLNVSASNFTIDVSLFSASVDNNAANNAASRTVTITAVPADLSVSVSAPASLNWGQTFDYSVTVSNVGGATMSNILVSHALPTDIVANASSPTDAWDGSTWAVGTLGPGASATLNVNAATTWYGPGNLFTGLVASLAASNPNDSNTGNNSASATFAVVQPIYADVSVSISAPASAVNGDTISYTVTVQNGSVVSAANGLTVSHSASGGDVTSSSATAGSWDGSTWSVGTLGQTASATLTIDLHVTSGGSPINLVATRTASTPTDNNTGNDTGFATINVALPPPPPTIDLSVSVGGASIVSGTASFQVTVSNVGDVSMDSIVVNCPGSGFTPSNIVPSQGSWDGTNWSVGTLASGTSATLMLAGPVTGGSGSTVGYWATLTGSNPADTNFANNDTGTYLMTVP